MSALSLDTARDQFTATLSAVENAAKFAFRRRLRPRGCGEAPAGAEAVDHFDGHGRVRKVTGSGAGTHCPSPTHRVKDGRGVGGKAVSKI